MKSMQNRTKFGISLLFCIVHVFDKTRNVPLDGRSSAPCPLPHLLEPGSEGREEKEAMLEELSPKYYQTLFNEKNQIKDPLKLVCCSIDCKIKKIQDG